MRSKIAIVFGIRGQDGLYLRDLLQRNDITVIGVSRNNDEYKKGDVCDRIFVENLIKIQTPEYIFHFAANSTTSHNALFENHETISTGTLNILEAVNVYSKHTKVFISGSGLQFENRGTPISEKDPFEAKSPYSISRIQSVYAARYFRALGIKAYVGYFFNHDSPYRSERHINQKIVQSVKRIASGSTEKIEIGNINVRKEFGFAGDFVNAVWNLVNNELIFETVIGSGKAYSILEWLEICFKYYNLHWEEFIKIKQDYVPEYEILVSDPSTLFSLNWKPSVDIEGLAKIMLDFKA